MAIDPRQSDDRQRPGRPPIMNGGNAHLGNGVPPDLLDHLPVSVVIVTHDTLAFANPAACRLFEATSPADILGHAITEFIHPLDQPRVLARVRRAEENTITKTPRPNSGSIPVKTTSG